MCSEIALGSAKTLIGKKHIAAGKTASNLPLTNQKNLKLLVGVVALYYVDNGVPQLPQSVSDFLLYNFIMSL